MNATDQIAATDHPSDRLRDVTGISDPATLAALHALQIDADSVGLLHLTPLVDMAWRDGTISDHERAAIERLATHVGVQPGSAARDRLDAWLRQRPAPWITGEACRVLAAVLAAMAPAERRDLRQAIARAAREVEGASLQ